MALFDHDTETVRKYLLGQLTDEQQQVFEQRLLTEAELTQEFEVTSEELVDEYLGEGLTQKEAEWFEQHFLASPDGKRSQEFATSFHRYISHNPVETRKGTWAERLAAFWKNQAVPVRAVAALALVIVVVGGIFWLARTPAPQSFATITLRSSSITRSGDVEVASVKFKEDALRINLILESPAASGIRYRAELIDGRGQIRTLEPIRQDAQSVELEIPSTWLTSGQYAINLSTISSDNTPQRIPGSYRFIIE